MGAFEKVAQFVASSSLKKPLYPIVDTAVGKIGEFRARSYDVEDTILAVCPGRSGSTWLAEIISSLEGSLLLWEPLHLGNNPKCKEVGFGWQNYFRSGESYERQKKYLENLYAGKDLSTRTLTSLEFDLLKTVSAKRYVVKHVNANMILHRIMGWFPVQAVLMIRHPCAVVSSQLRHGAWTHLTKENITIPDGMFEDFPHLKEAFEHLGTIEELLAFEWAVQTHIPLSQTPPHPWYLTTYERLVVGGEEEVERIFEYLEEPCPTEAKDKLEEPSATAGKEAAVRRGKDRLQGWTERLDEDQVERILRTVEACGVECYDTSLTPNEQKLPLRPEQPALFRS
jgi:hypothetical protein